MRNAGVQTLLALLSAYALLARLFPNLPSMRSLVRGSRQPFSQVAAFGA